MALKADRNTPRREGDFLTLLVAANKKIYAGALVVVDSDGYAAPGSAATGLKAAGRAESQADNTGGEAGAVSVIVRRGVFKFENLATDAVELDDLLSNCYIVDDETVAATDGDNKRSVAGKVLGVDADGVWVEIR